MLFLGVSEVVICNKTGARGDPTQLCLTSVTTFLKLKKKGGGRINLCGISVLRGIQIPSQTASDPNPELPQGGWGVR